MSTRTAVHRKIAQMMVDRMNNDSDISSLATAEQIANPKRRLQDLLEGQSLLDVIGQGARYEPRNRRGGDRTYIVWVAVHTRLRDGQVTNDVLDEAGYWAEQVQEFWHDPANRRLSLPGGLVVVLSQSEPFPVSREVLFGHGLHMATMQFDWQAVN